MCFMPSIVQVLQGQLRPVRHHAASAKAERAERGGLGPTRKKHMRKPTQSFYQKRTQARTCEHDSMTNLRPLVAGPGK